MMLITIMLIRRDQLGVPTGRCSRNGYVDHTRAGHVADPRTPVLYRKVLPDFLRGS